MPACRRWDIWRTVFAAVSVAALVAIAGCTGRPLPNPPAPAPTPAPLPTVDQGQAARGRQVYRPYCASCHGQNAEGAPNWQQVDARGNRPPPPHDDSGHTWRHSDAQLAEIIRGGLRDPFNKTSELTMPPFKDRLSDEEIAVVIAYLKSLWSPEHRHFQEAENRKPAMPMSGSGR